MSDAGVSSADPVEVAERLRRRYPPPRVSRRTKTVLVLVGTALALTWLVWTALFHARPEVSGQVADYEVVSDTEIKVTVTVERRDPGRAATCRLLAQSTDFQPVGEFEVKAPAGGPALANVDVSVTTLRRATSATVRSCALD